MKAASQFDLEVAEAMSEAYDKACRSMHDWGQLRLGEMIAKRIVQFASAGERNPDELCERALRSLGFSESPALRPNDPARWRDR
jgi:hypothetical protein